MDKELLGRRSAAAVSTKDRLSLSWSQSLDVDCGNRASMGGDCSQEASISQTQTEVLTQNPDLTQLGDFEEDCELSPLPPYSPAAQQNLPWGRMVPCSKHGGKGIDLLPKKPEHANSEARRRNGGVGVTCLGMEHLLPSDYFNEYVLGRSKSCEVQAVKPPQGTDSRENALQEWAYGMISNKHCRIYCSLDSSKPSGSNGAGLQVYIEDSSGNGTLVNKTALLRRGEKRLLHSGDEICFVNPQTLQKKVRSNAVLQDFLQHYSFVFINVFQQHQGTFPSLHAAVTGRPRLSSSSFSSVSKRRSAVDVRSLKHHNKSPLTSSKPAGTGTARLSSPPPLDLSQDSSNTSARRKSTGGRRVSPRRQQPRRIEEDYDIRDMLGSGTVGEVRRAIHRQTGQQRAVKIIALGGRNRTSNFLEANATFEAEAAILQGLDHPYVVKLIDVYVSTAAVYLVMELLHGGDLFDRIIEKGKYNEMEGRKIMRRLLSAIYYLHEERNIVHRDLKPENILCVDHGNDIDVKLTDFGLAKAVNGEDGLKTFCGTPQYFAPEVLRRRHTVAGRGRYGKQADMWSLGVVLYVLLSGTPPFDVGQGFDIVGEAKIVFPEEHWAGVSEQARDLVRKLLVADPRKRLSVLEACKHEWIMTDDGDTHVYPLDDPKLSVSKKRLFPLAAANDDPSAQDASTSVFKMDAPLPAKATNDVPSDDDTASASNASVGKMQAPLPVRPSNGFPLNGVTASASNAPSLQGASGGKMEPPLPVKLAADDVPASVSSDPSPQDASIDKMEVSPPIKPAAADVPINDVPASVSNAAALTNAAGLQEVADDPVERPVLLPLSLNVTEGTHHQVGSSLLLDEAAGAFPLAGVKEPVDAANAAPVKQVAVGSLDTTAVTPGASNKTQAIASNDAIPGCQPATGVELSDDEICSQFSENTESISAFSGDDSLPGTIEAGAVSGETPTTDTPSIFESLSMSVGNTEGAMAVAQSKKRRITDATDALMEPNKTMKTKNTGSGSGSASSTPTKGTQKKGGKQTTLKSWFKKPAPCK